jgi:hypothetical protein
MEIGDINKTLNRRQGRRICGVNDRQAMVVGLLDDLLEVH